MPAVRSTRFVAPAFAGFCRLKAGLRTWCIPAFVLSLTFVGCAPSEQDGTTKSKAQVARTEAEKGPAARNLSVSQAKLSLIHGRSLVDALRAANPGPEALLHAGVLQGTENRPLHDGRGGRGYGERAEGSSGGPGGCRRRYGL